MKTETIRVLHVIGGLNRGGAETMVMNLYRAIDRDQIQFDFIVHSNTENVFFDEIQNYGGKIYIFPKFYGKNVISYRRKWKEFFKEHPEYKIIHSHIRSYAILFLDIAKKNGLTTIVHSHSTSNGSGFKSFFKKILQYPLRKRADYLFACSAISGEWLFGKKALMQPNLVMLKNAIDVDSYKINAEIREKYRNIFGLQGKTVYGHIGRLSEPKNHIFLLEVFSEIQKRNQKAILLLVGSGNLKEQIEKRIIELGIKDKVIMTGARDDVPSLLQAMDVFLFPSLWEGQPVTVVEAQAAGLPCLVSNKVTDEVKISEAIQYLPIDQGTECWVEAALKVVGNRYDTINEIKRSGFDVHTSAEKLLLFYKGIVNNGKVYY